MRTVAILSATLAFFALPTAASAQDLGSLLRSVSNIGSAGSYCRYSTGVSAIACQTNRASNVVYQVQRIQRDRDSQRRQEMSRIRDEVSRQDRVARSLAAACKAGDQDSCGRSNGSVGTSKIASALIDACSAGDERSCARVRAMRNGTYEAPATARPASTPRADRIDPRTGFRIISGQ